MSAGTLRDQHLGSLVVWIPFSMMTSFPFMLSMTTIGLQEDRHSGGNNSNDAGSRWGFGFRPKVGRGVRALLIGLAAAARATSAAWSGSPDVTVTQGWMQVLLPSTPAAGYFTLQNRGSMALELAGASAPDCEALTLHQSTTGGGMARTAMVVSLPVAPGQTVRFVPGGYHLMCLHPTGALLRHEGTETVTLHFADGSSVTAPFAIQGVER